MEKYTKNQISQAVANVFNGNVKLALTITSRLPKKALKANAAVYAMEDLNTLQQSPLHAAMIASELKQLNAL